MPYKPLKKLAAFLICFLPVIFLAGCGGSKEDVESQSGKAKVIKFSHVVAEDTPKGKAALKFKEILEKNAKGKFEIQVYPSSSLFSDSEEMEQLKTNQVQFIAPSVTKLVDLQTSFQIVDMPFLFKSDQAAYNFYDGIYGQKLLRSLEPQGLLGLVWWPNSTKHFTNSVRPLKSPDDFKGLKFRIQSTGVAEAQFKALEADAQVLPFSEVYTALSNKSIDGQENTYSNIETQNYQDVQKYLTVSHHGRLDYIVVTNTIFWNSLSPEEKKIIEESLKEATLYERQLAEQENAKSYERLRKSGKFEIYTLNEQDREKFIKALEPVTHSFTDKIGRDYLESARNSS